MRRPLALAAVVLAASAGVALAQGLPPITVTVHATVTPNKAGTPAHPQGVHLNVGINIGISVNTEPPLVNSIDIWFPKGSRYSGGRYPSCPFGKINAFGPAGCPKASIMGHGGGVARADTNPTYPQITVVNGGQHTVYFFTVLNNPARVQSPVPGTITKLSGGPWAYKLHVRIPTVLQIVAGVPIVLQSLHISAGDGNWLATTYCPPSRKWDYHGVATFNDGQTIVNNGSVACR